MGRTEPSIGRPPAAFRRDARAKQAKATLNKTIPAMLSNHPRARRGIEASELIVPPVAKARPSAACGREIDSAGSPVGPRLTIRATDTLTAARSLISSTGNLTHKVAVLNMASPLSPGGGFVNGATSQEECLCMCTTLLPALKDEFYRLPEVGCVYTPDVLVFRSGDSAGQDSVLDKKDRWFVDVVSAAMLRLPETQVDDETGRGAYVQDKDRELVVSKMKTVMEVFQSKGIEKVVLGAWGCGAYGNPVGEIARAWRKVLTGDKKKNRKTKGNSKTMVNFCDGFDEIVFAIKDQGMAEAFRSAFGQGLDWASEDVEDEDEAGLSDGGDDTAEQEQLGELIERMDELRLRIDRTTNPQVKEGLKVVMAGLERQVSNGHSKGASKEEDQEDEEEEEEEEDQDDDEETSG